MHLPIYFHSHLPWLLVILAALGASAAFGIWFLVRGRKKPSDAERERQRRLAVNAVGRMTDGTLLEGLPPKGDSKNASLLFYQYSVSGVEYSAAQDISSLLDPSPQGPYWPGSAVTVKYHPQNPSNSIVACELWSGLHENGESGKYHRNLSVSCQGVE